MSGVRVRMEIAASLMCCDFLHLGREIEALQRDGCDMFHVDVMDGNFVDNFAMSAYDVKFIKSPARIPIDVHMMVKEPIRYVESFKDAGADILSVHYEACRHIYKTLQEIKDCGLKAGIALNPGTSHLLLEPLLDCVDMILIMSVNPGFAGQSFIPYAVEKTKKIKHMLKDTGHENIKIQVDGNINSITIPPLYEAGADIFVAGTSGLFFGDNNYKKNLCDMRNSIKK